MKTLTLAALLALLCIGCDKNSFNVNNPDVTEFVTQLKNGTYDTYARTGNGERLWPIMPSFDRDDVPALISLAGDTDLVSPCDHFPVNPLSSMYPWRLVSGKPSIMLGEYLLWCAEAVIEGKEFASLNPVLVEINNPDRRLDGNEIMAVRELYQKWWDENGHLENPQTLPLDGSGYSWH
ncbi:MAG: DUF4943 domain-containing protein [Bacteroidales bacterium]|jgi:hypothetical protein|nr:DUF4943 domain-containing protein [Bacteroidales bacterium]